MREAIKSAAPCGVRGMELHMHIFLHIYRPGGSAHCADPAAPRCIWLLLALLFRMSFFASNFCMIFGVLGSVLNPKIDPKSVKIRTFWRSVCMHAFSAWILWFVVVFEVLRTSKSMLPCTGEHESRKIAVFAPGSDFRWFLVAFSSLLAPKTLQNDLPKRLQKSMQIYIELLSIFGSIFDPFLDPNLKKLPKIY